MLLRALVFIVLSVTAFTGSASQAQSISDIDALFERFTVSLVAGTRCSQPSQETMNRFFGNLMIVQELIVERYRERYPNADAASIGQLIDDRIKIIGDAVEQAIASKGCNDPDVVKMIDLFQLHSRADLFGTSQRPQPTNP